jgi:hypothetical protein
VCFRLHVATYHALQQDRVDFEGDRDLRQCPGVADLQIMLDASESFMPR